MHACDAAFIKFRCGRGIDIVLHPGPIRRREPFVGRVLGARGYGVLEVLKGFSDIVGHGDVDIIVLVVQSMVIPQYLLLDRLTVMD